MNIQAGLIRFLLSQILTACRNTYIYRIHIEMAGPAVMYAGNLCFHNMEDISIVIK